MAQCIKCMGKVGFFSKKTIGVLGPYCPECSNALSEALVKFIEDFVGHAENAETDPKAAAWAAVASLPCARQVNLLVVTHVGGSAVPLKKKLGRLAETRQLNSPRPVCVKCRKMALGDVFCSKFSIKLDRGRPRETV